MNNSTGYSKENCVVCCSVCNTFKSDKFTYTEMLKLGETRKISVRNEKNPILIGLNLMLKGYFPNKLYLGKIHPTYGHLPWNEFSLQAFLFQVY